jgi:tetratricopeptide (TPR) repeat protein
MDNNWRYELNKQMQEGYHFALIGDGLTAVQLWIDLWKRMVDIMQRLTIDNIDEFDEVFDGEQSIGNWAIDFDLELENASRRNKDFAQMRIDFCTQFISKSKNPDEHNQLEMRRAIAESYYELGKFDEGEKLFKEYTANYPAFGWYWIGWSDQYGLFAQEGYENYEKAIDILKQALEVEELSDRQDVLERLESLYVESGMLKEAEEIRVQIRQFLRGSKEHRLGSHPILAKQTPAVSVKIGRNDPCPCGSGLKHKKCCGK